MTPRLSTLAHGRANNFQLIRLLAAVSVVLFHCYALTDSLTAEPLWRLAPEFNFGVIGVGVFFVVSGFLVTQSWLAREDPRAFIVARVLRIYPALVAATLFSILLAGASSTLPWGAFLFDQETLDYAWRVALGWRMEFKLPGAFVDNPFPEGVNGSLWTLPVELRLYVAVLLAGLAGLIARRALWLCVLTVLVTVIVLEPGWFPIAPNNRMARELALCFALGSAAWVVRDWIPVSLGAAAAVLALVVWNPAGLARGPLFAPLLAYLVLVAAYHPRLQWPAFNRLGDYSYGVYVYSFPLQQLLMHHWRDLGPMALLALSLPATLAVAALSWHVLERPALDLKSRLATRSEPR